MITDNATSLDSAVRRLREQTDVRSSPGRATTIAAAPGRLDVMGGIADYSGSVVLEATIGELAVVALQRRDDRRLTVRTSGPQTERIAQREVSLALADFYRDGGEGSLRTYDEVRALFAPEARWAAYVLGVFYVLLAEGEAASFPGGADLWVHSTVPLGAGVASSAALEVATMRAVVAAYGLDTSGMRLASLCQIVENRVVGAPCGIMDQVTCTLGRAGALLALRCQPHEVLGWHAPPAGYAFVGLDSGVKHAVGGVRYPRVRCAAFMGREIVRAFLRDSGAGAERATHLCNLTPAEYRRELRHLLPARLTGRDFLSRWGQTQDAATSVDPDESYPVRGATAHPIYENARVLRFLERLRVAALAGDSGRGNGRGNGRQARGDGSVDGHVGAARQAMIDAGRLMYGSHRSYSRNCGLGSRETDLLVSLVRRATPQSGLLGAKITGGGSGGTVAVLLEAEPGGAPSPRAAEALDRVSAEFLERVGRRPRLIAGTSPGAAEIEPLTVRW